MIPEQSRGGPLLGSLARRHWARYDDLGDVSGCCCESTATRQSQPFPPPLSSPPRAGLVDFSLAPAMSIQDARVLMARGMRSQQSRRSKARAEAGADANACSDDVRTITSEFGCSGFCKSTFRCTGQHSWVDDVALIGMIASEQCVLAADDPLNSTSCMPCCAALRATAADGLCTASQLPNCPTAQTAQRPPAATAL